MVLPLGMSKRTVICHGQWEDHWRCVLIINRWQFLVAILRNYVCCAITPKNLDVRGVFRVYHRTLARISFRAQSLQASWRKLIHSMYVTISSLIHHNFLFAFIRTKAILKNTFYWHSITDHENCTFANLFGGTCDERLITKYRPNVQET